VDLDPNGRSSGLVVGWNPTLSEFHALGTTACIFLEGRFKNSTEKVKLLSCYALYKDGESFWQPILDYGLLSEHDYIVGGALNFTLSSRDIWCSMASSDPLSNYFSNLLQESGLVDLAPSHLTPT